MRFIISLLFLVFGYSLCDDNIFEVQSEKVLNVADKHIFGLNLDFNKIYSESGDTQCGDIFKMIDAMMMTSPGFIRTVTSSNGANQMTMDSTFYKNFFKLIKDMNSNVIFNSHGENVESDIDVSEKIIIADEIGFKQVYVEINLDNINSTCDQFLEELEIMKNITSMREESDEYIELKVIVSNIHHCLFEKSEMEQKLFIEKLAKNSDAIIFNESNLNATERLNILQRFGTEAWLSIGDNELENSLVKTVEKIGNAMKSGYSRIFYDFDVISRLTDIKGASESSGLNFLSLMYEFSTGISILNVTSISTENNNVNVFAQSKNMSDSVFLYAVNLGNETENLSINLDLQETENPLREYIINEDRTMQINELKWKNTSEITKNNPLIFSLPPHSIGVWPAIPVKNRANVENSFDELRAKRETETESEDELEPDDTTIEEVPKIIVLFVTADNETDTDFSSILNTLDEQYLDEMNGIVSILQYLSEVLKYFSKGIEDESNDNEDDEEMDITTNEVKRQRRQIDIGESESEEIDRMGKLGKPLGLSPSNKLKLDSMRLKAKQAIRDLKHKTELNLKQTEMREKLNKNKLKLKLKHSIKKRDTTSQNINKEILGRFIRSIDNHIMKIAPKLKERDLIAEGSDNSWSWENIKCSLGFCEEKNPLEKMAEQVTSFYNNVREKYNKALELFQK